MLGQPRSTSDPEARVYGLPIRSSVATSEPWSNDFAKELTNLKVQFQQHLSKCNYSMPPPREKDSKITNLET